MHRLNFYSGKDEIRFEKQGEQKPADKVEPKLKVEKDKWYVCIRDLYDNYGTKAFYKGDVYYSTKNETLIPGNSNVPYEIKYCVEDYFRLWTIQDAKDGDVLAYVTDEDALWIMIYRSLYEPYEGHVHYHALLVNDNFSDKGTCCICINDLKPATKEQRDLLFAKMKEAGYEWDAEKKELKKIHVIDEGKAEMDYCFTKMMNGEKVSSSCSEEDEEYNGEDYGIDGLWHAMNILERTLGKVSGYQTDDGILSHKCAITAVKKLYKQKTDWSEEDSVRLQRIIDFLWYNRKGDTDAIYQQEQDIDWLKSLKERYTWKPSDDQMYYLSWIANVKLGDGVVEQAVSKHLNSLYDDLKKLKE